MCTKDLLQTAIKFGDRQVDELARLSHLSAHYRAVFFRALHHARCGRIARVVEILETELETHKDPKHHE
jgi:hypothetical protein